MITTDKHRWQFAGRFRRNAFGWRSQPAIQRVREAVSEIKRVACRDPILGAEGAVLFLEKVSAALEHVDSSSGAIGTAVNHAIGELVSIIAKAPVDLGGRTKWLDRLWDAYVADAIPYIETLGDFWGELCATKELASVWADNLIQPLRAIWRDRRTSSYFQGTAVCLSSLLAAGRYQELLGLLEIAPFVCWAYRQWGVRALAAMGKSAEVIRYARCRSLDIRLHRQISFSGGAWLPGRPQDSLLCGERKGSRAWPALSPDWPARAAEEQRASLSIAAGCG